MKENKSFNDEWNKLQKAFWENVGAKFVNSSYSIDQQQSPLFKQWLSDVDKCWHENNEITSTEIDALYQKISSSSRFFINFTETVSSTKLAETTEVLYEKVLDGFNPDKQTNDENSSGQPNTSAVDSTNSFADINSIWGNPSNFIVSQQQSFKNVSGFFEDSSNNPEFDAAVKVYLTALQKYQLVFFDFFKASAIQTVETLKNNRDKLNSPTQFMSVCLEVLEDNYMLLILEEGYSQAYAEVVNSWMLMISKSSKSFADFMQSSSSSNRGPTHAK